MKRLVTINEKIGWLSMFGIINCRGVLEIEELPSAWHKQYTRKGRDPTFCS
jgi:hypothetical protein